MAQIWLEGDSFFLKRLLNRLTTDGFEPVMRRDLNDEILPMGTGGAVQDSPALTQEVSRVLVLMLKTGPGEKDGAGELALHAGNGTNPGSVTELYARARADLRPPWTEKKPVPSVHFGQAEVDFERWTARVEGRQVPLTRKAFQVLRALASQAGRTVTREALLDEVWGYRVLRQRTRVVDMAVGELRERLEPNVLRGHIVTVRGVGYRLECNLDGA